MYRDEIPDLSSDETSCCGCAACYSICPTGAIYMLADKKGFRYPHIDEEMCIRCQRCMDVCAFKKDKRKKY